MAIIPDLSPPYNKINSLRDTDMQFCRPFCNFAGLSMESYFLQFCRIGSFQTLPTVAVLHGGSAKMQGVWRNAIFCNFAGLAEKSHRFGINRFCIFTVAVCNFAEETAE
ncbi:hypothetical protein [Halomonas cibimaris]|uniref:hypothetical protein n=1 Tax=Halomonas cibimaris TaxID=657012 RepID=UPI0031D2A026